MAENGQKWLESNRPPRVKVTYDVEIGGAVEKRELPFIVGVFADLSGQRDPDQESTPYTLRMMVSIDRDLFNDVMKAMSPRVALGTVARIPSAPGAVSATATANLSGDIRFDSLDSFEPVAIVKAVPDLNKLYGVRGSLRELQSYAELSGSLYEALNSLLHKSPDSQAKRAQIQQLVDPDYRSSMVATCIATAAVSGTAPATGQGNDAVFELIAAAHLKSDDKRQTFLDALGCFVSDILTRIDLPDSTYAPADAVAAIDAHISDIDHWLSQQLSAIMHAPTFQEIEATWRGLHYLVSNTETDDMLKIKVFNATKQELLDDMESAVDIEQSKLFKIIYEAEYGTLGGQPYSLLLGGYEMTHSTTDIGFLNHISQIAAAAHAPYITAVSADFFSLSSFRDLARPRDLAKIFEGIDFTGWQTFRDSENSRYVSLVMPHVLMRLPYGKDTNPVDGMDFEETVGPSPGSPDSHCFLWGNAAYMLAQRVTNAFSTYHWPTAIRGADGGGLVEGLPVYSYRTESGSEQLLCPTEVSITDQRLKELTDLGFIPLCYFENADTGKGQAAFFGGQTTNLPKKYFSEDANANAQLSALLPYLLASARFVHYIKVIMGDKIGSFLTRANVETYLNTWISNYVLLDDKASGEAKASLPLSQANVVISEVPGEVGAYNAVLFLRPHFQLEELTTSIRLIARLPK